jgi:hypothetical protein
VLQLKHSFVWCWNLDNSGRRSEIPGSFEMWCWIRMEISSTDCVRNEVSHRVKEDRNIPHTIKRKANWIGHILLRNCLLKHVIEGRTEVRIEVMGRWGRSCKKLLEDLKETTGYWKLKEEALVHTLWRTHFGRGYGPVVRQTVAWINFYTVVSNI